VRRATTRWVAHGGWTSGEVLVTVHLARQVAVGFLTLEALLITVERAARAVEGKRYAFKLQEKTRHVPTPDSEATHIDACDGVEPGALAYGAPSSEFAQVERHASATREALERRERDDD
jgi:hypothetical protein